jgi:serine/threonine protein kinase
VSRLRHPNLTEVYEIGQAQGIWFFTMELLHGHPLLAWARPGADAGACETTADALEAPSLAVAPGRPDFGRVRDATLQIARGIAHLHDAGVLHRDVKPSNVLVTREGVVKLLDFSLAGALEGPDRSSTARTVLGTAAYAAPEVADDGGRGPAADWYSVGVLLYRLLTGRLPFEGDGLDVMLEKRRRDPPPPRAVDREVPADLDALCAALLRRAPAERPDGRAVLQRLSADQIR